MKEATGELNSTVIILTAVALLSAVFFTIVWPIIKEGMYDSASCANAVCDNGYILSGQYAGQAYCYAPNNPGEVFTCPFRG